MTTYHSNEILEADSRKVKNRPSRSRASTQEPKPQSSFPQANPAPPPANEFGVSNFSQQKLRAWQPVLTPKWIISVFIGFGILFAALGIVLLMASNSVTECILRYGDPEHACSDISACTTLLNKRLETSDCSGPSVSHIKAPIYLYYGLRNFYQNHRRYIRSRNDAQLRGEIIKDPSLLSNCEPFATGADGRIYSPCGLIALSVFNDSYSLSKDGSPIKLFDDAATITWPLDAEHRFKNPINADPKYINEWLNEDIFPNKVENGHFIVWMRNAALPDFKKLYAKIDQDLHLPIDITIYNRYPVDIFGGHKMLVLSTTSWLGGKNNFLGIAYIVMGCWCLLFSIFFLVRNCEKPR